MKNIQSASAAPGQIRRRLTSALLTLSLIGGTIATTATPVEAATSVIACFTPSVYNYRASGVAVLLQVWNGGDNYSTIGTGVLSDYGYGAYLGCAAWNVPPLYQGRQLRVKINDNITYYGAWCFGQTTFHAGPGYGPVVLSGVVTCYGCKL